MKHISTIVNMILAVILILILLSTGLPNFNVRAAEQIAPTPTATAGPIQESQNACDPNRNIHVSGTAVVNVIPDRALILILVGLAIYDNFAGRPGGIIAEVAASLVHRGVIPGLIVPGRARDAWAPIHDAIRRPDASFLGVGDLILPVTLVARAAVYGIDRALVVTVGILIAAGWLGRRGPSKPFPALVPLAAGSAIPYLLLVAFRLV